jgi:hypothetical protein
VTMTAPIVSDDVPGPDRGPSRSHGLTVTGRVGTAR